MFRCTHDNEKMKKVSPTTSSIIATFSCLGLGGIFAYLVSLTITSREGANGLALVYLLLPMVVSAYYIVNRFRYRVVTYSALFISLIAYTLILLLTLKEQYMAQNCRMTSPKMKLQTEQNPACQKLRKLPRW